MLTQDRPKPHKNVNISAHKRAPGRACYSCGRNVNVPHAKNCARTAHCGPKQKHRNLK